MLWQSCDFEVGHSGTGELASAKAEVFRSNEACPLLRDSCGPARRAASDMDTGDGGRLLLLEVIMGVLSIGDCLSLLDRRNGNLGVSNSDLNFATERITPSDFCKACCCCFSYYAQNSNQQVCRCRTGSFGHDNIPPVGYLKYLLPR